KWFYENQGTMRFGSENRIFMVLVNTQNLSESWKLKRNFNIIRPKVFEYLDNFTKDSMLNNSIEFEFSGRKYNTFADIIPIIF
ncbi:hypothetical protein, partial [Mailhella sp.]|uniref:hypothetical protein n=1 Tax=Mailhella sp. TaxID=1981029 RepID=UPI004063DD74